MVANVGETRNPISVFSRCHEGILERLEALQELPSLLEAATRARRLAGETLEFFHRTVRGHHVEEERDLFPAVLASAAPGNELEQVELIVERLTREHREVEAAFERLEPGLRAASKGHDAALDAEQLGTLIQAYEGHARYEEREFLPLSERILGRDSNHMAALGLALHLRHALPEVLARYGTRI
jgi:hemerythrin-like domain-containing protein